MKPMIAAAALAAIFAGVGSAAAEPWWRGPGPYAHAARFHHWAWHQGWRGPRRFASPPYYGGYSGFYGGGYGGYGGYGGGHGTWGSGGHQTLTGGPVGGIGS